MILSLPEFGATAAFDVCVVGSGPAGMTLATALHAAGKRVLVLEAGGREYSDRSQEVYRGEVRGDAYHGLDYSRLRYFGGTSNHWAGRCRPLDAVDFEPRAGIDGTGWPIAKRDLDPYGAAAARILRIPGGFSDEPLAHGVERLEYQWSDPLVRFGPDYLPLFEAEQGPVLCLQANVTGLSTGNGRVTAAAVQDYEGHSAQIRAGSFVLACGAIENSRLLLHFDAAAQGRLVPRNDILGRYMTVHPHTRVGDVILEAFDPEAESFFALDAATRRELGLLNCQMAISEPPQPDSRARALAYDLACIAPGIGSWIWERMGRDLVCGAPVIATWEQAPDAGNRVTLSSSAADIFGIPAPVLHLHGIPEDRRTVRESLIRYGEFLARSGSGRVRMAPWLSDESAFPEGWLMGQYHQMGGTRMSARAGDGVVDPNLKVWGQDNLYVVGSSVFPTGGHANPTYTIVQLALRLADRLAPRL